MKDLIKEQSDRYTALDNKNLKWDVIKCELRGFTVSYSKRKAYNIKQKEKDLHKQLEILHSDLASSPNDEVKNKKDHVQAQLDDIKNRQVEGIMIRSHARWCEQGEKSTKYFLSFSALKHSTLVTRPPHFCFSSSDKVGIFELLKICLNCASSTRCAYLLE